MGTTETSTKTKRRARAKLTPKDVLKMRSLYKKGTSQAELSDQFKVSPSTVSLIVNGLAWRNVK